MQTGRLGSPHCESLTHSTHARETGSQCGGPGEQSASATHARGAGMPGGPGIADGTDRSMYPVSASVQLAVMLQAATSQATPSPNVFVRRRQGEVMAGPVSNLPLHDPARRALRLQAATWGMS
jgi:hypothetical protein